MTNNRPRQQDITHQYHETILMSCCFLCIRTACQALSLPYYRLTAYLYALQTFRSDSGIPLRFYPQQFFCPSQSLSGSWGQSVSSLSMILHLQTESLLNMTWQLCTGHLYIILINDSPKWNKLWSKRLNIETHNKTVLYHTADKYNIICAFAITFHLIIGFVLICKGRTYHDLDSNHKI